VASRNGLSEKKALIIGCGIAGPVLAMFLQRAGISAVIYEGRPAPRDEEGAFLNLAPNGLAVLDQLDVADQVVAYGSPTTTTIFQNHRGKRLGENPETTTLIKRGLLNRALREAAIDRGITVEWNKRLVDVEITPQRTVVARFEDGSEAHGDFLVGCDGIHSRTRRVVMPNAPRPQYTGTIDCGAFTRLPHVKSTDGAMYMTFGLKGFFGYQVVPDGEIYWFENFWQEAEPDRAKLEAISTEDYKARLLELHKDDHDPICDIIRSTEGLIARWPIYDLPPLDTWHKGPVCLIGDAAHATSPHVGQGASMALEDAIVLAKCLRDIGEIERAFETFEKIRKERVERAVKQARRTGNQKSPGNAFGRAVRDLILPFFLKQGVKQVQWIYEYRVDWDEKVPALLG